MFLGSEGVYRSHFLHLYLYLYQLWETHRLHGNILHNQSKTAASQTMKTLRLPEGVDLALARQHHLYETYISTMPYHCVE